MPVCSNYAKNYASIIYKCLPEPRFPLQLLTFGPLGPGTNTGLDSDANRLSACLTLGYHITELGQFESFVHRGLSGRA